MENELKEKYIQVARAQHCDDEVEIDDNPKISEGEEGAWVAAWVWVDKRDVEDDEEEEE